MVWTAWEQGKAFGDTPDDAVAMIFTFTTRSKTSPGSLVGTVPFRDRASPRPAHLSRFFFPSYSCRQRAAGMPPTATTITVQTFAVAIAGAAGRIFLLRVLAGRQNAIEEGGGLLVAACAVRRK